MEIYANNTSKIAEYRVALEKIEDERKIINYTLNEIVTVILDSAVTKGQVIIPEKVTEFERALFHTRKTQHNNNQFEPGKELKTLLEFEFYRTKGEELYIILLLTTSTNYLGAPLIANNYIQPVFPDIFKESQNPKVSSFLVNHYVRLLIQIDSLELAKKIYSQSLDRYKEAEDGVNRFWLSIEEKFN